MNTSSRVAVIGASGFIGSAATAAIEHRGFPVAELQAPRLPRIYPEEAISYLESGPKPMLDLAERLANYDVVVNAAGIPDASCRDIADLSAANGVLPGLIAAAGAIAGINRFVHVSSAVVQGRLPVLDESEDVDAFSEYARSKLLGEQMARLFSKGTAVIYRPPSVHGINRRVTRMTARIGSSRIASVAYPRTSPSPQALISNVADAIAFLGTTTLTPPSVVIHPWEGLTTTDVLEMLGGRSPLELPRPIARSAVTLLAVLGRLFPGLAADARRVEMLWFGQLQAPGWLTAVGWAPPHGMAAWTSLGNTIRRANETERGMD